jgi:ABC-type molybdate transport system substrate-binding protein
MPQGAVVIKGKRSEIQGVQEFYTYLFSPEAKGILQKFGYSVHE